MNRRRFLLVTASSLVGIVGIGSIIQKLGSTKTVPIRALNSKLQDVGFSIRCALVATEGRLADKMGEVPFARMEFGQVLVDRFFLDESELIQATKLLNRK